MAKLTASDAAANDFFGFSVDIDGDTVVVGASGKKAVYVFRTTDGGATYGQVAKLTASDAAATTSATPWRSTATPSWSGPTATKAKRGRPTSSARQTAGARTRRSS